MSSSLTNEKGFLERIAAGDEMAFATLVKAHWPQVYGTSLRLTRSPEQAKDLAQDIFIKLWNNRNSLKDVDNINNFIYVSARHLVMDFLEKKVLTTINLPGLIESIQESTADDPQLQMEFRELQQQVLNAIQALPEKLRKVFVLHRFEGKSHREIAGLLNISEVSSKTYVVRALKELRHHLSGHTDISLLLLLLLYRHLN